MNLGRLIFFISVMLFTYALPKEGSIGSYNYTISNYKKPKLSNMTLDEKIAQMIMVRVSGKFYNNPSYSYDSIKELIQDYKVGGIIMFYADIHGAFHNINLFQSWADIPLLVGSDYERGLGQWMDGGTLFPSNMAIAATRVEKNAYKQGEIIAKEAKSLGVHAVFAPVLDINNNPNNPIINLRSYSDSPDIVSKFGVNFIEGIQDQGVIACAKHFPGHGDTDIDSHTSLPTIHVDKKTLYENELFPFKAAVNNNVKMIMAGHLIVPSLDPSHKPTTHSERILTGVLRKDLGFKGIVITDAMEMGALSSNISNDESVIRTIEAGSDIVLLPIDAISSIKAIKRAVKDGRISEKRIDESVERILKAKEDVGLFNKQGFPDWSNIENLVGSSEHKRYAKKITAESITLVKDDKKTIPLKPEKINKLSYIVLSTDDNTKDYLKKFSRDIVRTVNNVNEVFINYKLDQYLIDKIIDKVYDSDIILISSLVRISMNKGISTIDPSHLNFLKKLKEKTDKPIVLVSFGSPYMDSYDYFDAYITTYGYGPVSVKAAADAIFGREKISGKLPIDLNKTHNKGVGLKRLKRLSEFKINKNNKYKLDFAFAVIDSAIQNKIFPGAQIFISKGEDIIAHKGIGTYTYEQSSSKVDTSSIYDIASITKAMSVVPIVMKLVEKKRLSIRSYVSEYYPDFISDYKKDVKIEHLLTHSSGIKGYIQYFKIAQINTEDEVIEDIISRDLEFKPGSKFEYSDLGFILLKDIIEKANRSDFENLTSRWIYKSLGMSSTYFNPESYLKDRLVPTEYDSNYRKKMVHGIVHDENAFMIGGVSGHAGLFSNAWDIAIFTKLFLNDGVWLGKRHFNKSTIRKFIRNQNMPKGSDMALGWDTPSPYGSSAGDYFSNNSFGHLGFTGTSVWADKEKEIIIIMLTNRVHPSREKKGIYGIRREFYNRVMKEILN